MEKKHTIKEKINIKKVYIQNKNQSRKKTFE